MVTSVRIDGCADHMNKKPDLIIKIHKIITSEKIPFPNFNQGSDDCKAQNSVGNCCKV